MEHNHNFSWHIVLGDVRDMDVTDGEIEACRMYECGELMRFN